MTRKRTSRATKSPTSCENLPSTRSLLLVFSLDLLSGSICPTARRQRRFVATPLPLRWICRGFRRILQTPQTSAAHLFTGARRRKMRSITSQAVYIRRQSIGSQATDRRRPGISTAFFLGEHICTVLRASLQGASETQDGPLPEFRVERMIRWWYEALRIIEVRGYRASTAPLKLEVQRNRRMCSVSFPCDDTVPRALGERSSAGHQEFVARHEWYEDA